MKFDKIIIVGGGSAGWMTAATFIHQFPKKEITVIESLDYPIVGVGESTIGGINDWLTVLGISDTDFLTDCDATYKLSIRFEDFYKKGDGGFHYPFGLAFTKNNKFGSNDWYYKKAANPNLHVKDYADCYFPQMAMVNQNKLFKNLDRRLPNFNFNADTAFHFDATKFGLWLKEKYCFPRGVKYIQDHISSIETDDEGIKSLNNKYSADLYVDCTGFQSLLLGETLKEPYESYEDILPNNSAWATRIQYKNKEEELKLYTNCTAIENGWIWHVPLWSRIGSGYVYSDKYVSDEQALNEFKKYLKFQNCCMEDLEFRNLKMKVGIYNRLFVKNVCAIGLSAGFIEPLEGNGLFSVHDFLLKLVKVLKRDSTNISQFDKDTFNITAKARFRTFAEFVALHYSMSHRDDTNYWKDIKNRQYGDNNLNYVRFINGFTHIKTDRMIDKSYEIAPGTGLHCIATGMGYFPICINDILELQSEPKYDLELTKKNILNVVKHLDEQKTAWADCVRNEKSAFDFLKVIYDSHK